jgi:hypothetical protein
MGKQHSMELQTQASYGLHNPQLLTPLLRHPSISQDQLIIAALQATSKQLQAAVAQQLPEQLPVLLRTNMPSRMQALAQWLQKHAGICQGLELHIIRSSEESDWFYAYQGFLHVKDVRWPDAIAAVSKALQEAAAATGTVRLQSFSLTGFSLTGSTAVAALLQQMPAQHLTRLCVEVDYSSSVSLQAVAALTGLHSLRLISSADSAWSVADDTFAPLAAGLQQLTQLQVGPVLLDQLKQLPPKLQQLHVDIDVHSDQLVQLADWLQQRSGIVSSLGLRYGPRWQDEESSASFKTAMEKLFASIQAAASSDRFGLESLSLTGFDSIRSAGPLLLQLPAGSLTELRCGIDWGSAADVDALCSLTRLRSLHIECSDFEHVIAQRDDALAPLSALQRLTQLHLQEVRSAQLAVLQLPRLQRLQLQKCVFGPGQQLQLDHLTALQQLQLLDCGIRSHYMTQLSMGQSNVTRSSAGRLPPNLHELQWRCAHHGLGIGCSVQQLLPLSRLQKLVLLGRMPEAEQQQLLPQLTSLVRLTEIGIRCSAATAAACWALPIKALAITSGDATPSVLQRLCTFSSLTYLNFCGSHLPARLEQLSAALTQLTALQHLSITSHSRQLKTTAADCPARSTRSSRSAALASSTKSCSRRSYAADCAPLEHDLTGVVLLLRAVACLPDLGSVLVELPVTLKVAGMRQIKATVQEHLHAWLQRGFKVSASGGKFDLTVGCSISMQPG